MPKAAKQKITKKMIHPDSRKASQLSRQEAHRDRMQKNKTKASKETRQLCSLLLWFQDRSSEESYTHGDVCDLIAEYISRFDEELEEIRLASTLKGRQVRPHASREDALRMVKEKEEGQFTGPGFDAPDMTNAKNLDAFRAWDKKAEHVLSFKMAKFRRPAVVAPE